MTQPTSSTASFNLSLPVSHFQQSQQPPQLVTNQPPSPVSDFSIDDEEVEEDGDDGDGVDEEDLINELLDEALNLTSDEEDLEEEEEDDDETHELGSTGSEEPIKPVIKDFASDLKATAPGDSPASVLRTQSVLLRSRVSFPATGRNRRKNSPPVARKALPPPPPPPSYRTLPSSSKKRAGGERLDRRILPMPPPPPPPPKHLEFRHVKQNSIDSGVIGVGAGSSSGGNSSNSSNSSSNSQSGDSSSETNSDMAIM